MKIPVLTALALAASLQVGSGADITGKVILKGTPKAEIPIDMAADPKCGAMQPTRGALGRHFGQRAGHAQRLIPVLLLGVNEPADFQHVGMAAH